MRSHLWLLAAAGHLASADWDFGQQLQVGGLVPRQTKAAKHDGANGWTPRPTDPPANHAEFVRRSEEWMRKKRQTDGENTWVNDETCGWIAGSSSAPFACEEGEHCATDRNNVVGCTSSGMKLDPFFTVCYDHIAVSAGLCSSAGTKTGCCASSTAGACVTYVWPGETAKSMYRCWTKQEMITMLDEPQFVIDARTRTTSTPSSSTSIASSTSDGPSPQSTTPNPDDDDNNNNGGGGNNTGAIVGGVVGGVAGIALIAGLIAFLIIRNRKKEPPPPGAGTAYSAVAPGDPAYPHGAPPAGYPPNISPNMSQQPGYFPSPSADTSTLAPGTPYLGQQGNTPPPMGGAYDPRQSYYDPMKMGAVPPPGAGYPPYAGTPPQQGVYGAPTPPGQHGAYGAPGAYPPPQQQAVHMAELDTTALPSGHAGNPVEMAAGTHTER